MEQSPVAFLNQENADSRLLVIIKNKDIAGHVHKVNHQLNFYFCLFLLLVLVNKVDDPDLVWTKSLVWCGGYTQVARHRYDYPVMGLIFLYCKLSGVCRLTFLTTKINQSCRLFFMLDSWLHWLICWMFSSQTAKRLTGCVCTHQIPGLVALKRHPNVVFVGIDTLEDIRNNSYNELFVSGGCIVSDELVLNPDFITHGRSGKTDISNIMHFRIFLL